MRIAVLSDTTEVPLKKCTRCGEEKPATNEYFSHDNRVKSGLLSQCKMCRAQYRREWYEKNPEKTQEYLQRYRESHPNQGRNYQRRRRQNPEVIASEKAYKKTVKYKTQQREYKSRPEVKQRLSEWRKRPEQREKRKLQARAYRQSPQVREKVRERDREYSQMEGQKLRHRIKESRRRARIRNLPDTFTPQDWQRAIDYFHGCCAVCGRPQGLWHTLAADHWIPLSSPDCPGTIPTNIVPLCHSKKDGDASCNLRKLDANPSAWLRRLFDEKIARTIEKRIDDYFNWVAQCE